MKVHLLIFRLDLAMVIASIALAIEQVFWEQRRDLPAGYLYFQIPPATA